MEEINNYDKISQMILVGIKSKDIDFLCDLIKKYKIGGVILYKDNYNTLKEMIDIINKLKEANKNNKYPLFISIDQEGGRVNRLPKEIINIPSIYDLTQKNDISLIEQDAYVTSKILNKCGINMNLAPVLDINNEKSKVLYKRCFSNDVNIISNYSATYIKKMKENNIISVIKHFPGHGISPKNTHLLPIYVFNYKEILNHHIIPFENAIQNNCDAIMINHLVIRKLTHGLPASISKKFIKYHIRDKYNYSGILITDDVNMASVKYLLGNNRLKVAFNSGSDIIMLKLRESNDTIIKKIFKLLDNKKIDEENLNKCFNRICGLKNKYALNNNQISYFDYNIYNELIKKIK